MLSTLRWFRDEYEAHIYERSCPAHVCPELVTYSIDVGLCKGCHLCVKKCPADAIVFGSLMDPESRVSRLARQARAYQVLGGLNTKTAVIYLKKITQELG